jgi:GT2 family glycosyltransferase
VDKESASIVIPNWNGRALLVRLLERLAAQTRPPEEVLVVDNGSTDGSAEAARALGARVIEMGSNAGFARAVNRGVGESAGAWIGVVNNDVEPREDWLERLLEGAGQAWFATGKILSHAAPAQIDGAWDALARSGCACRCGSGAGDGPRWSQRRRIRIAPLTAALVRRATFERIGMLDERFESYLEDVDFGLRCALAGLDGAYVPEAVAWHRGSATLGAWSPPMVRLVARNQVLLVAKHFSKKCLMQNAWAVLAGQALWGVLALRHGSGLAYLRGKWEGLRRFRAWRGVGGARLEEILVESEAEIRTLAREEGSGWYWRLYCALT